MTSKTAEEIRTTRTETLLAAWLTLTDHFKDFALVPTPNMVRVAKVVEEYIQMRDAFIRRHKIHGRIQRPKIAGLMASAILKYKPVDMNDRDHSPLEEQRYEATQCNEFLAFWHGLMICAEGTSDEKIEVLFKNASFKTWQGDLYALFEHHPDSPECFVLIFETLAMAFFPESLHQVETPKLSNS